VNAGLERVKHSLTASVSDPGPRYRLCIPKVLSGADSLTLDGVRKTYTMHLSWQETRRSVVSKSLLLTNSYQSGRVTSLLSS